MEISPFKLLLLDAAGHSAMLADGPSGWIIAEMPLPEGLTPVSLATAPTLDKAYIALAGPDGSGHLLSFNLRTPSLTRVPLAVPQPTQIALSPDGTSLLLADPSGTPYYLDLVTLSVTPFEKPTDCGICAGLALTADHALGVWETGYGGVMAALGPRGSTSFTRTIGGLPTSLTVSANMLMITFTATPFSGEGVICASLSGDIYGIATLQCSRCAAAHPIYPVHAIADPSALTAYVACEESATVAAVNLANFEVIRTISVGRSVSRLALIPDSRFAVAACNATADLCLIDLVNSRPLSISASRREILSLLAIVD